MESEKRESSIDTNLTTDESPSRPLKRLTKKESRLNQFLKDLVSNAEQHKSRSIFLRTIQDRSSIVYNNKDRKNMATHGNSVVDNIFDSVLKDSLHRRIRRLTADIEGNIKIKESKDGTKLPAIVMMDTHVNLETPRIVPRPFSPVEKQSAKMFLKKIKAFKERRRKNCSIVLLGKMALYSKRLLTSMASFSYDNTPKTTVMEAWELANSSNEESYLSNTLIPFNREDFTKNAEHVGCEVPTWAKEVLRREGPSRTVNDVYGLLRMLSILKKFNEKFTYSVRAVMCRMFTYSKVPRKRIVLREGHIGHDFYLIYTGSVFVNKQVFNKFTQKNEWKTVNVLRRGDSFGELALLQLNSFRSATIVTRDDTEFLIVPRDVFSNVCPKALDAELNIKIDLIKETRVFQTWSEESLQALCLDSRVNQYPTNSVIVGNSKRNEEWLFMCLEGKCMAVKRLKFDPKDYATTPCNRSHTLDDVEENPLIPSINIRSPSSSSATSTSKDRILQDWTNKFKRNDNCNLPNIIIEDHAEDDFHDVLEHSDEISVIRANAKEAIKQQQNEVISNLQKRSKDEAKSDIFMNIACLTTGDIFNFSSFMEMDKDSYDEDETSLISLGCKVVQIRRDSFFYLINSRNLYMAKEIAELSRYPNNEQLVEIQNQSKLENVSSKISS
ncbi:cyclic nucleotide-binding domain-containing protein 2-like [Clytia hemisphaerica]|uniref:Cyclic nucleotide-binding domain-containing protein n=1 Tax=Clytia hemisphaerica TaxID=252671 RepID=A0A7M5XEW4_9CNID